MTTTQTNHRQAKQACRDYLATFDDSCLAKLIDDLRAGQVEFLNADKCLLGHGPGGYPYTRMHTNLETLAEMAFADLGRRGAWQFHDNRRNSILLPIALSEVRRRELASVGLPTSPQPVLQTAGQPGFERIDTQ